ncbi:tetratricopeptide repeat protein [Acidobacteriota bacterium]
MTSARKTSSVILRMLLIFFIGAGVIYLLRRPMARILDREGMKAFEAGNNKDARMFFRMSTRLDAEHPPTWLNLGTAYHRLGNQEDAIEAYRLAQRNDPTLLDARLAEARCLVHLGQEERAYAVYSASLRLDAENRESTEALADLAVKLGKYEDATEWIARNDCPDGVTQKCLAGAMLELGRKLVDLDRVEDALDWFSRAADQDFQDPAPLYEAGSLLNALERYEEAELALLDALDRYPEDLASLCELAWSKAMRGMNEKAVNFYRAALEIEPDHISCLWGYSVLLEELGNRFELESVLKRILASSYDDEDVKEKARQRLAALALQREAPVAQPYGD